MPARFGDLVAGVVELTPGPCGVCVEGFCPLLRAVGAIERFLADFSAEMEVRGPLFAAVFEVEGLRAFEDDFAVGGARGSPLRFEFSVRPLLGVLCDRADRIRRRRGRLRVRKNPGFVEANFVVDGVLRRDDMDDAVEPGVDVT